MSIILFSSCRTRAAPFSIYKDSAATGETDPHQPDQSHSWRTLGARVDRNKENNAIPGKWKSFKVLNFQPFACIFMVDHNNLSKLYLILGVCFYIHLMPKLLNDFRFHGDLGQDLEGLLQVPLSQCLLMKNVKSKWNLHKFSLAVKFTLRIFLIGNLHCTHTHTQFP